METFYKIKKFTVKYKNDVKKIAEKEWGSNFVVSMGKCYELEKLKGFVVVKNVRVVGFVSYEIEEGECEIVAIYSAIENNGIGSALIQKVKEVAKKNKCARIKLITTNDNIKAIYFYQKRGFSIAKIYVDAVKSSRKLKPQIPLIAENGIAIRDEIEFEMKI